MKNNFKYAKSVIKYLEKRYGRLKGNTIADDVQYIKDIVNDHTTEDLQMMSRRINAAISYKKDTGYLDNHIVMYLGLLIPVFTSMGITIFNIVTNYNLAFLNNFLKINENQIKDADNLSDIFTSIDLSAPVNKWVYLICLILLLIFIAMAIVVRSIKKPIDNLYCYSVIIEEAIEQKKYIKRKRKRHLGKR
ncbi:MULTISPECIES: hypothetical protein [unclassified Bacillus (in: firmicutes)]|uniref:hypothetical protein n=1 Tax=unclassified Bacillus (in: firmicutes) TaxID=185979 RepID=UPI001BEC478E|nr:MULTISPECIES: hypothetical protein [unclassified Bacillus (in: firmicutes)]MBT2615116.1 hypothetical protein [Bacillus sp. ISL-78]MBT2628271.1 hypothetical protein [Bacillus sp. ISL-101]